MHYSQWLLVAVACTVIKLSRNGVFQFVSGVPPPEIVVPPLKVVAPPSGYAVLEKNH